MMKLSGINKNVFFRAFAAVLACLIPMGAAHAQTDAISVDASYVGEVWSAVEGADGDAQPIQQADIGITADLEQLAGWKGATAYAQVSYNDGGGITPVVGDAQIISNIEAGVDALRLYEAWLEQEIGGSTSVKIGLIDLNTEFDVLESASLFINSAHGVGSVLGLSGANGPSIFPVTGLGARAQHTFGNDWTLRAAVFDGVPGDPNNPRATVVKLGGGDGALLIAELDAPIEGGQILFGHWRFTGETPAVSGEQIEGNEGWYLRAEKRLHSHPLDPDRGLDGFIRLGTGDAQANPYNRFVGAGLAYTGAIASRPDDQIGLAIATAFSSSELRTLENAEGAEVALELTYSAQLTDWLRIQPDAQYILNPAANRASTDTLVLGLRVELSVGF